jgi:hypothetical protein
LHRLEFAHFAASPRLKKYSFSFLLDRISQASLSRKKLNLKYFRNFIAFTAVGSISAASDEAELRLLRSPRAPHCLRSEPERVGMPGLGHSVMILRARGVRNNLAESKDDKRTIFSAASCPQGFFDDKCFEGQPPTRAGAGDLPVCATAGSFGVFDQGSHPNGLESSFAHDLSHRRMPSYPEASGAAAQDTPAGFDRSKGWCASLMSGLLSRA